MNERTAILGSDVRIVDFVALELRCSFTVHVGRGFYSLL